jgi:hypothetical protein
MVRVERTAALEQVALSVTPLLRAKLHHACDQCPSSWVFPSSYRLALHIPSNHKRQIYGGAPIVFQGMAGMLEGQKRGSSVRGSVRAGGASTTGSIASVHPDAVLIDWALNSPYGARF